MGLGDRGIVQFRQHNRIYIDEDKAGWHSA